jgi:hypothetical protein
MKHLPMADRHDKPPDPVPDKPRKAETPFDVFLRRGLHRLFDAIANEPIPPKLLKVIEDHKKRSK